MNFYWKNKNKIIWILVGNKSTASSRIEGYCVHKQLLKKNYNSYILFDPVLIYHGTQQISGLFLYTILKILLKRNDILILQKIKSNWNEKSICRLNKLKDKGVSVVFIDCDLPIERSIILNANKIIVPSFKFQEFIITNSSIKNQSIAVLPDSPEIYIKPVYHVRNKIAVCWFGSMNGKRLKAIDDFKRMIVNDEILSRRFSFITVSDHPSSTFQWSEGAFQLIHEHADIVVIPVEQIDEAEKLKSANKVLQAMALGKPVLASPIPEYTKHIVNGFNGYLCDDYDEFRNSLFKLMNTNILTTMQNNAFAYAEKFSIDSMITEWIGAMGVNENHKALKVLNNNRVIIPQWLYILGGIFDDPTFLRKFIKEKCLHLFPFTIVYQLYSKCNGVFNYSRSKQRYHY